MLSQGVVILISDVLTSMFTMQVHTLVKKMECTQSVSSLFACRMIVRCTGGFVVAGLYDMQFKTEEQISRGMTFALCAYSAVFMRYAP